MKSKKTRFLSFLLALALLSSTAGAAQTSVYKNAPGLWNSHQNSYEMQVSQLVDTGDGNEIVIGCIVQCYIGNGSYFFESIVPDTEYAAASSSGAYTYTPGIEAVTITGPRELTFSAGGYINILDNERQVVDVSVKASFWGS